MSACVNDEASQSPLRRFVASAISESPSFDSAYLVSVKPIPMDPRQTLSMLDLGHRLGHGV
jgi:hypothetical protein